MVGTALRTPLPTLSIAELPAYQHDLAARLAGLQQGMRPFQIGRIDRAKGLIKRGAQHAFVDEVADVVEQGMLTDHVRCLERRAGKHRLPVNGDRLALENT